MYSCRVRACGQRPVATDRISVNHIGVVRAAVRVNIDVRSRLHARGWERWSGYRYKGSKTGENVRFPFRFSQTDCLYLLRLILTDSF